MCPLMQGQWLIVFSLIDWTTSLTDWNQMKFFIASNKRDYQGRSQIILLLSIIAALHFNTKSRAERLSHNMVGGKKVDFWKLC